MLFTTKTSTNHSSCVSFQDVPDSNNLYFDVSVVSCNKVEFGFTGTVLHVTLVADSFVIIFEYTLE